MDNSSKLYELARDKFGKLTKAEKKLFQDISNGESVDYSAENEIDNDPANAESWGSNRVLLASRIVWLCIDKQASQFVTYHGIQIIGARIDEPLNLMFAKLPFVLYFAQCKFTEYINIVNAEIGELNMSGTHTGPLYGDGLKTDRSIFLCDGFQAKGPVRLVSASVNGDLDCSNAQFINRGGEALNANFLKVSGCISLQGEFRAEGEVLLNKSTVDGDLNCNNAKFVNKGGNAFSADRLRVEGGVYLRNGFQSEGEVRLLGARIGGNLDCVSGHFINKCGIALHADGLHVDGEIILRDGFMVEGMVRLPSARVGGNFDCNSARFINEGKGAIIADGLDVGGNIFLGQGFQAGGQVRLFGAVIGGSLDCRNACLMNKGSEALIADGLDVKGSVFLNEGFRAEGQVRLFGAMIGVNFDCTNGQFSNKNAVALSADGLNVKRSVFLCGDGFKLEGAIRLRGARIGGDLDCRHGTFIDKEREGLFANCLNVQGDVFLCKELRVECEISLVAAHITGLLHLTDLVSAKELSLDLRYAHVGTLRDEQKSWPESGKLFLDGLVYDDIHNMAPKNAEDRIDWIHRQGEKSYWLQPYEHLAKFLRESGDGAGARNVLIAKNRDKAERMKEKLTYSQKFWYHALGPLIGYGYKPLLAMRAVIPIILVGWLFFAVGYRCGLITPQSDTVYTDGKAGVPDPGDPNLYISEVHPVFNSLVYSIDTFVPVVDFHQAKYWLPNANRGNKLIKIGPWPLHTGGLLLFFLWIETVFGWVLTTLFIAGLSGLIQT